MKQGSARLKIYLLDYVELLHNLTKRRIYEAWIRTQEHRQEITPQGYNDKRDFEIL